MCHKETRASALLYPPLLCAVCACPCPSTVQYNQTPAQAGVAKAAVLHTAAGSAKGLQVVMEQWYIRGVKEGTFGRRVTKSD